MSTAKQDVESLLNRLPDSVSAEDIQYHIYVLDEVLRGLEDARVNATLSQEEVESASANGSPNSSIATSGPESVNVRLRLSGIS